MRVWRIATASHRQFDGAGPRRHGSRWTPKGQAAVYASATLSLAALERFVHTDPDLDAPDLVAISIDIPTGVVIHSLDPSDLPADWREYPAPDALARIGDSWLREATTGILAVPSAVIPHERNYLLNPAHSDVARLVIGRSEPFGFDPRMWKRSRR